MRLPLVALLLTGCYLPLAGGGAGPSAPGLISVVPGTVVLGTGGQSALDATLLAPGGSAVDPQPMFTFRSLDESIATVDASGLVTGVALGATSIEVSDGVHGTAVVAVFVVEAPPVGPAALTCVPPIVAVAPGVRARAGAVVTSSAGARLDLAQVELRTDDPAIATADAAGEITGVASGRTTLRAFGPDGELAGSCDVVVVRAGPGIRCEDYDVFEDFCSMARYPRVYLRPGLSSPLRVYAASVRVAGCGLPTLLRLQEHDPTSVVPEVSGVVSYFGGRMQALAPGYTRYRVTWGGAECGTLPVHVGLDVVGTWQMQCEGGDRGVVMITSRNCCGWQESIGPHGAAGAPTRADSPGRGNASICMREPTPRLCQGEASIGVSFPRPRSGGQGTCAATGGCSGAGISHCGMNGVGSATIEGPDQLKVGDCTYTRGGASEVMCEAEPVGGCSPMPSVCPGVPFQFCIDSDLRGCRYLVGMQRFECDQCPPAAGAACVSRAVEYVQSICGS